jgi:methionine-gamma-lyase
MAAISATLLQLCSSGDYIVCSNTVYGERQRVPLAQGWPRNKFIALTARALCPGGTFALLKSFFPTKCGITTTFVDITNLDAVAAAITTRTKARRPGAAPPVGLPATGLPSPTV